MIEPLIFGMVIGFAVVGVCWTAVGIVTIVMNLIDKRKRRVERNREKRLTK